MLNRIISRIGRLFVIDYRYDNVIDQRRAQTLLFVGYLLASATFITIFSLVPFANLASRNAVIGLSATFILPVVAVLIYMLLQRGRLRLASWIIVILLGFITSFPLLVQPFSANVISTVVPVVLAGLLLSRSEIIFVSLIQILIIIQSGLTALADPETMLNITPLLIQSVSTHIVIAIILIIFSTNLQSLINFSVEEARRLRTVNQSASQLLSTTNTHYENEFILLGSMLNLIRDELGYAFAQVFMANDSERINRRITFTFGQESPVEDRLPDLGDASAIFEAANTRQPVQLDLSSGDFRRRHFVVGTLSGIAVPITSGNILLGVLDVQLTRLQRLNTQEVETLMTLASQFGALLSQWRLMQDFANDIQEQQEIIVQQRDRLREYDDRQFGRQREAWQDYLDGRRNDVLGYNWRPNQSNFTYVQNVPESIQQTMQSGSLQLIKEGDDQYVGIPIILRGQVLGAISFKIPEGRGISIRQRELLENVIQRFSLALENRRLFEQSASQAQRESTANEVGNTLLGSTDIETVLQLAAENFNQALGAVQTRIYVNPDDTLSKSQQGESR